MKKCPYCQGENADDATLCAHCGRGRVAAVRAKAESVPSTLPERRRSLVEYYSERGIQSVRIVDVEIPFGSMLALTLTWTLAAIPAIIIASIVVGGVIFVLALIGGAIGAFR